MPNSSDYLVVRTLAATRSQRTQGKGMEALSSTSELVPPLVNSRRSTFYSVLWSVDIGAGLFESQVLPPRVLKIDSSWLITDSSSDLAAY